MNREDQLEGEGWDVIRDYVIGLCADPCPGSLASKIDKEGGAGDLLGPRRNFTYQPCLLLHVLEV